MIPDNVRGLSQVICLFSLITTIGATEKYPSDKCGTECRVSSVLLNLHKTFINGFEESAARWDGGRIAKK
jgi:hypothetical protein